MLTLFQSNQLPRFWSIIVTILNSKSSIRKRFSLKFLSFFSTSILTYSALLLLRSFSFLCFLQLLLWFSSPEVQFLFCFFPALILIICLFGCKWNHYVCTCLILLFFCCCLKYFCVFCYFFWIIHVCKVNYVMVEFESLLISLRCLIVCCLSIDYRV